MKTFGRIVSKEFPGRKSQLGNRENGRGAGFRVKIAGKRSLQGLTRHNFDILHVFLRAQNRLRTSRSLKREEVGLVPLRSIFAQIIDTLGFPFLVIDFFHPRFLDALFLLFSGLGARFSMYE